MNRVVSSADVVGATEKPPAEAVEIAGVIKWFDVARGYGFITPDNGEGGDILLHITCLRHSGFQTVSEGVRVVCLAQSGERGRHTFKVLSVDLSTALVPERPERSHVAVKSESGLERVLVKWFNPTKGFGFLTRGEGTEDIFIHKATLRRFRIIDLQAGQAVLVRYAKGDKGLMAAEIYPDRGTTPSAYID